VAYIEHMWLDGGVEQNDGAVENEEFIHFF